MGWVSWGGVSGLVLIISKCYVRPGRSGDRYRFLSQLPVAHQRGRSWGSGDGALGRISKEERVFRERSQKWGIDMGSGVGLEEDPSPEGHIHVLFPFLRPSWERGGQKGPNAK